MVGKPGSAPPPEQPTRRVIVLGASNAVLGLSTIVQTSHNAWGGPLDFMAAIGHGRSYGLTSRVLGRSLPGIAQSGIWNALEQRPHLPTAAIVTDIGNDILYGSDVKPILRWVESCLQKLAHTADRLVITRLPIKVVSALPAWKYRLLTSLIFPSSRIEQSRALDTAEELDFRLLEFAKSYGAYVIQPDATWYGWDPIHIARRHRSIAWRTYFSYWSDGRLPVRSTFSIRRSISLSSARPVHWKLFGFDRHRDQPCVQLSDGTQVSLF